MPAKTNLIMTNDIHLHSTMFLLIRLRRIAERDSLILEVLSTMLDSQISGNNVEELKKTKQKLTNYLAQNQR